MDHKMATEKTEKYIISLDALDINLLTTNFISKFENVSPFWTKNNLHMRNNDYYEFQIRNSDNDENKDDEISNITCHMCNIDVPEPFLKQHHDSFKHKINIKIADVAVERLKKTMHNSNYCNDETQSSLHFCPVCVAVVKIEDKTKHNRSIGHKNSLLVDKLLNDFYILYTDNINENDVDGDACLNDIKKDLNKFKDQEIVNSKIENDINHNDIEFLSAKSETDYDSKDSTVIDDKNDIRSDRNSEIDHDITHSNSIRDKNHNDNQVIEREMEHSKIVDKSNKKKKNKANDSNEEPNFDTLPVPKDIKDENNQSIIEIDKRATSENIPKVKRTRTKKKAKSNDKDTIQLSKGVKDGIRKDDETASSSIAKGMDNTKKVSNAVKTSNNTQMDAKIEDEICEICNKKNADHSVCQFLLEELSSNPEAHVFRQCLNILHYHFIMKSDMPFCMVCKMNFFGNNALTHLFSEDHFDNYDKLIIEHALISDEAETICEVCNIKFVKEKELLHCEDMNHITRLEKYKNKLRTNKLF